MCRQNLSDMGHEFDIADLRNILDKCLGSETCGKLDGEAAEQLFPNSLAVPGTQHILDSVLQEGVEILPWWTAWDKACKNVCQVLHAETRRYFLKARLPEGSEEASSLDKT